MGKKIQTKTKSTPNAIWIDKNKLNFRETA